jgi:hypothetical protein
MSTPEPATHLATVPYDPSHPDALAIYCSDGRFTDSIEQLLHGLGHPRLDTMTLPGGAALFEVTTADFTGLDTVRNAAQFLVRGHGIQTAVLVAHDGCGYYRARHIGQEPERIVAIQESDLRSAARWFHASLPAVRVELFFAYVDGGRVAFRRVPER